MSEFDVHPESYNSIWVNKNYINSKKKFKSFFDPPNTVRLVSCVEIPNKSKLFLMGSEINRS